MERYKSKIAVNLILTKENQILLARRFQTGWQDGNYGLPSGHLETDETLIEALLRETKEEIGINLDQKDVKFIHVSHSKFSNYTHFFFTASKWTGEPSNQEPNKCDDVKWFPTENLPKNIIPLIKEAIIQYQKGSFFSECQQEE